MHRQLSAKLETPSHKEAETDPLVPTGKVPCTLPRSGGNVDSSFCATVSSEGEDLVENCSRVDGPDPGVRVELGSIIKVSLMCGRHCTSLTRVEGREWRTEASRGSFIVIHRSQIIGFQRRGCYKFSLARNCSFK